MMNETPQPPMHTISRQLVYWRGDRNETRLDRRGYGFVDKEAERFVAGVIYNWLERYKITRHHFGRDENDNLIAVADDWIREPVRVRPELITFSEGIRLDSSN